MDVDAASSSSYVNEAMNAARHLVEQPLAGGYPSAASIIKTLNGKVKNRLAFDIVEPKLHIRNERVWLQGPGQQSITLFTLNEPLISQLIFLKPFICPENLDFFVEWIRQLRAWTKDPVGNDSLFAGSDDADEWFHQQLPVIDMTNPLEGALQSLQFAKLGR